jgi:uncharacterized protein YndB with AHSA1/START domain
VIPLTVSTTIRKPREEVFDYLADIANLSEFMDHFLKDFHLLRVDSYGKGAGVRFRSSGRMDRFGWGELNVLECKPPYEIVYVGRGGKYNRIETYAHFRLDGVEHDKTEVEFRYETQPVYPSDRLIEGLSRRRSWFKRQSRKGLKRLRAILEDGKQRGTRTTVAGL